MKSTLKANEFLKEKYLDKKKRNSSYSVRAFAKNIGLSSGGMSRILNGTLRLSGERAKQISEKLQLNHLEKELFQSLLEVDALSEGEQDRVKKESLLQKIQARIATWRREQGKKLTPPENYSLEAFTFANLIRIGVQPKSTSELAMLLKKSEPFVRNLVAEMIKDQWIRGEWGSFEVLKTSGLVDYQDAQKWSREIYRKIFELGTSHLEKVPGQDRAIGFEAIVIDEALWPELKALTNSYLDRVAELSVQSKNPKLVVQSVAGCFITHKGEVG